jgi:hypothetical protein
LVPMTGPAFGKLGVRSRVELALLGESAPSP